MITSKDLLEEAESSLSSIALFSESLDESAVIKLSLTVQETRDLVALLREREGGDHLLIHELRDWLNAMNVTKDIATKLRRSCSLPWATSWNVWAAQAIADRERRCAEVE